MVAATDNCFLNVNFTSILMFPLVAICNHCIHVFAIEHGHIL
jgi:hypothetical protein